MAILGQLGLCKVDLMNTPNRRRRRGIGEKVADAPGQETPWTKLAAIISTESILRFRLWDMMPSQSHSKLFAVTHPSLHHSPADFAGSEAFAFGDCEELAERLLRLVRAGVKSATCSAAREYGSEDQPLPVPGRINLVLHWDGTPALAIEITEVTKKRFCEVDESFALAEGENSSLAGWRNDHRSFFERNGGFDPEMELVCERFRVIAEFSPNRD